MSFFRPTSDVNISKSVYPIYLKIKVQRVPTSHSSHINFWVNRITRFRDIDVGSWPKKTTKKTKKFWPPFIYIYIQHVPSPKESNLTTWQPDNLTTWQLDTFEHLHENKSCSACTKDQHKHLTFDICIYSLLSLHMKTKVAQHVPRINISIWHMTCDMWHATCDMLHNYKYSLLSLQLHMRTRVVQNI